MTSESLNHTPNPAAALPGGRKGLGRGVGLARKHMTSRQGRCGYRLRAVLASAALMSLGGCDCFGCVNKRLPNCGSEESHAFSSGKTNPAVDEGEGRVSFVSTSFTDTGGGGYLFTLLRCETGVQISAFEPNLVDPGQPSLPSLAGFIETYRAKKGFADPLDFYKSLQRLGYKPFAERVYSDDRHAACVCRTFYPGVKREWLVRSPEQIAAEKAQAKEIKAYLEELLAPYLKPGSLSETTP